MKNRYDGNKTGWSDGELPSVSILCDLMEYAIGSTYPRHILERRINLLTPLEYKRFTDHWIKIADRVQRMDDILVNRSEILNDPWK